MSYLSAFNKHMEEFLTDIITVFPKKNELKRGATAIRTLIKFNPKMCIRVWKDSVIEPYRKEINEGDFNFFISKDYKEDVEGGEYESVLSSIDEFRQPIREMGEENQKKALQYIKNLSIICDKYFE